MPVLVASSASRESGLQRLRSGRGTNLNTDTDMDMDTDMDEHKNHGSSASGADQISAVSGQGLVIRKSPPPRSLVPLLADSLAMFKVPMSLALDGLLEQDGTDAKHGWGGRRDSGGRHNSS